MNNAHIAMCKTGIRAPYMINMFDFNGHFREYSEKKKICLITNINLIKRINKMNKMYSIQTPK